jgi:hypothetical protein
MKQPNRESTETTKKKKVRAGRLTAKDLLMPVIIMLALVAAGIAVILLLSRAERVTIDEPVYQYMFQNVDEYPDGIAMKKTKDALTIDNGFQEYETNDYPFYYENRDALVLTNDFLYMNRTGSYNGRVEYFTEVAKTADGITFSSPKDYTVYGGMLHDGKDIFIFLEETTVTWNNGETKTIPALSTVACFQGETLLIYSYGEDSAIYEELDDTGAVAEMENGIKIDLVRDAYYKPNGTQFLLFSSPETFDVISKDQEAEDE